MAFETVRDIIEHARHFHNRLSEFYQQLSSASEKEKIRILLNYMSRHEQNMAECLTRYEKESARKLLDTWFKFPPEMAGCKCFECVQWRPDMSVNEIIDLAMKVDACLISLYRKTAEKAVSQEIKDLFTKLLEMEQKEETNALRNALNYDEEL